MNQPASESNQRIDTVRRTIAANDVLVFVGLVAAGSSLRMIFEELPNFAPVAAIALFAGFYLRSCYLAVATPLAIMAITDSMIGGYDWLTMSVVYGFLVLPVLFRPLLRRSIRLQRGSARRNLVGTVALFAMALASSLMFFLGTNFAVWLSFDLYETSWPGLVQCYVQAVPFFRYTLAGDALFAVVLFGSYATAVSIGWARESQLRAA